MRRSVGVGLVIALAGVLAACSASTEAAPARTPAASSSTAVPSPTATPTLTAPVMPELAKQRTYEGAQAFVEYWFATATYSYLSGDVEPLKAISRSDCNACNRIIDDISSEYATGGRYTDYSMTVKYVAAPPPDDNGAIVSFGLDESKITAVDAQGRESLAAEAASTPLASFFMKWEGGGWKSFGIGVGEW